MRLDVAEDRLRYRTQHVTDTVRLTQVRARLILNAVYRETRTNLQRWAPRWALNKTATLTVAAGASIDMSVSATNFEKLWRLETKGYTVNNGGSATYDVWLKVDAAGEDPTRHRSALIWFEERGKEIVLQPEGLVAGTFRGLYHYTPSDLAADASTFDVPAELDPYLISKATAEVFRGDGDERVSGAATKVEALAQKELDLVLPGLARRYGSHEDNAGYVEVVGY